MTNLPNNTTNQIDKQSLEYVIKSGLSGGLAGISAKTLIAPLDRVKILFQTNNPHYSHLSGSFKGMIQTIKLIYKDSGFKGLYQGHSATLLRIFPYAAIKFVCYEQIRTILIPKDEFETTYRRLLAGSLAGIISVSFTYPLDLIRVRLAFEIHNNHNKNKNNHHKVTGGRLVHILKTIYNENPRFKFNTGGYLINNGKSSINNIIYNSIIHNNIHFIQSISNFYRGFLPTILGMIPYAGVSFYTHDLIHDIFRSPKFANYTIKKQQPNKSSTKISKTKSSSSFDTRLPLNTWAQLIAGGMAGMLAQASAYPFEVIRRRMQVGGVVNNGGEFFSIAYTAMIIYSEKGWRGFYVGLGIGFIKIVPMFACSFYVYERSKKFLRI
ncbi:hypothetical protein CANARDRAFT_30260 [[Candida] arabinofermentans NRRL YB-2248]|uniref:Mitochondrial carrier protein LEU5 n=1 Tax=[Candida] arabinofermentans NRRL YB-2248 TaxID=983967 RepID=A0A1E4SUI4_9ASCO|nr:hypothetical protein CANARDRAFT_30260 [[Candida] arabinofermentans NRRL YB-2248]